jgi:hypothetical protein
MRAAEGPDLYRGVRRAAAELVLAIRADPEQRRVTV